MQLLQDILIVLVVLTNFMLLTTSRLPACIRLVAVQGVLLALLPLIAEYDQFGWQMALASVLSGATKGVLMPWLLLRAIRGADIRRELEPYVGYTASLLFGAGMIGFAIWLNSRLPLPGGSEQVLLVPTAFFTLMSGLFLIVARRKAITQVVGYLMMENGIHTFGLAFARSEPLLVELGMLLDIFVAVFVMGIAIYHINREFDSIDTTLLSRLKD